MYTELNVGFLLKKDTPTEIITALSLMVAGQEDSVASSHPFFTRRDVRRWALRSGGSYYFHTPPMLNFHKDSLGYWWFGVVTNIKNYNSEWELFLDWVGPHIDAEPGEYLGTYRYEEWDRPHFVVMGVDGKVKIVHPKEEPDEER